jgi:hypothetical protein
MHDMSARIAQLQSTSSELNLFALVDGIQYEAKYGHFLQSSRTLVPLFAETQDAALSHAGPWVVNANDVSSLLFSEITELEAEVPSLVWVITNQEINGLAQLLRLRLDVQLPDGRLALLRFWDPRVLINLTQTLNKRQLEEFFGYTSEWHLLHQGQRLRIGRHHADT